MGLAVGFGLSGARPEYRLHPKNRLTPAHNWVPHPRPCPDCSGKCPPTRFGAADTRVGDGYMKFGSACGLGPLTTFAAMYRRYVTCQGVTKVQGPAFRCGLGPMRPWIDRQQPVERHTHRMASPGSGHPLCSKITLWHLGRIIGSVPRLLSADSTGVLQSPWS